MRFHALLPARDEADIIGQSLSHMLTWADAIYVFDTGSVDRTWEMVQDLAASEKRIVPLKRDTVYFSDTLVRGWIFHQARKNMRNGDWFLRVDADEFHSVLPPEFVKSRMRKHETVAWHQYYDFQLTESEARGYAEGKQILADRERPIEQRRRWFIPSIYSEPRLCRYRETMQWAPTASFPFNSGYVARERLPIRHYPNRDPIQMERRCRLRVAMMQCSSNWNAAESHHWLEDDWRKFIAADDSPELQYWRPGSPLPELHFTNHIAALRTRTVQRFAHGLLLPLLDRSRPKWPEGAYPQKIPGDVIAELDSKLSTSGLSIPGCV